MAAALGKDELLKLTRKHSTEELAWRGLVERTEAITITLQTPETVTVLHQPYERHERLKIVSFGKPVEMEMPQSQFIGRQKMFGDLRRTT